VAYNRRFYNTVRDLKIINSQSPGFFNFYVSEVTFNEGDLLESIEQALYTNTVHMFDLIKFIVGDYELVNIEYHKLNHNLVSYIYQNSNFIGILVVAFNSKRNTSIEFENPFLNISIMPLEKSQKYNNFQVIEPCADSNIRKYVPVWESSGGAIIEEPSDLKPGFFGQYEEFYEVVEKGIRHTNLASLNDAHHALLKADIVFSKFRVLSNHFVV
jgi:predicted dehydrogenase